MKPWLSLEDRLDGVAINGNMEYRERKTSFRIKKELIFKHVESFMDLWTSRKSLLWLEMHKIPSMVPC